MEQFRFKTLLNVHVARGTLRLVQVSFVVARVEVVDDSIMRVLVHTCVEHRCQCAPGEYVNLTLLPLCARSCGCVPLAPAGEELDIASEPEETFSWKNVLKDVLRLREEKKLSEGISSFTSVFSCCLRACMPQHSARFFHPTPGTCSIGFLGKLEEDTVDVQLRAMNCYG